MAQIRVENLRKDFGAFNAVKSSSFTVEERPIR
jgi:multiple sugar transport system ATP-binding protein